MDHSLLALADARLSVVHSRLVVAVAVLTLAEEAILGVRVLLAGLTALRRRLADGGSVARRLHLAVRLLLLLHQEEAIRVHQARDAKRVSVWSSQLLLRTNLGLINDHGHLKLVERRARYPGAATCSRHDNVASRLHQVMLVVIYATVLVTIVVDGLLLRVLVKHGPTSRVIRLSDDARLDCDRLGMLVSELLLAVLTALHDTRATVTCLNDRLLLCDGLIGGAVDRVRCSGCGRAGPRSVRAGSCSTYFARCSGADNAGVSRLLLLSSDDVHLLNLMHLLQVLDLMLLDCSEVLLVGWLPLACSTA